MADWATIALAAWPISPLFVFQALRPAQSTFFDPRQFNLSTRDPFTFGQLIEPYHWRWRPPFVHVGHCDEVRGTCGDPMLNLREIQQKGGELMLAMEHLSSRKQMRDARVSHLLHDYNRWLPASVCPAIASATAHVYVSTPGRGTDEHEDPGDILVLQLHGSKEWTFARNGSTCSQSRSNACLQELGRDVRQATLTPGSMLWLPALTRHAAFAVDASPVPQPSIHVTLEVASVTLAPDSAYDVWSAMLVEELGERAAEDRERALDDAAQDPHWHSQPRELSR